MVHAEKVKKGAEANNDEILHRKKSPYPKTYDPRYQQMVTQKLESLLQNPSAPIYQIVKKEALVQLLTQEFKWPWYGQLMGRPQTIAWFLQIEYWLRKYRVEIIF